MCQSIAEGGKRCAAHCRERFDRALADWRTLGSNRDTDETLREAAYALASTDTGRDVIRAFVHDQSSPMVAAVICNHALDRVNTDALIEAATASASDSNSQGGKGWLPGPPGPQVVHVDEDRNLTYTWNWLSDTQRDIDSLNDGWIVSRLDVTHTTPDGANHPVGYLKVVYSTPAFVKHAFRDVFEWEKAVNGTHFPERDLVSPQEFWVQAHQKMSRMPRSVGVPPYRLTSDHVPSDLRAIAADIKVLEKDLKRGQRSWLNHVSVPIVDFSRVYTSDDSAIRDSPTHPGSFIGQGVGSQMYISTAQALGNAGMMLGASSTQTDAAKAVWERLAQCDDLPVRTIRRRYKGRTYQQMVLDYRAT